VAGRFDFDFDLPLGVAFRRGGIEEAVRRQEVTVGGCGDGDARPCDGDDVHGRPRSVSVWLVSGLLIWLVSVGRRWLLGASRPARIFLGVWEFSSVAATD
jgi:hypothetical protein